MKLRCQLFVLDHVYETDFADQKSHGTTILNRVSRKHEISSLSSSYPGSVSAQQARVPVLRCFGRTLKGESVCARIHGVFPYIMLYSPLQHSRENGLGVWDDTLPRRFSCTLEDAIREQYHMPRNRNIIHSVCLVKGMPCYGYHPDSAIFFKVEFYHTAYVKRAVNVCTQSTAVGGIKWLPHEAHLSFELQFLVDFDLGGMSWLDLSDCKSAQHKTTTVEIEVDVECRNVQPADTTVTQGHRFQSVSSMKYVTMELEEFYKNTNATDMFLSELKETESAYHTNNTEASLILCDNKKNPVNRNMENMFEELYSVSHKEAEVVHSTPSLSSTGAFSDKEATPEPLTLDLIREIGRTGYSPEAICFLDDDNNSIKRNSSSCLEHSSTSTEFYKQESEDVSLSPRENVNVRRELDFETPRKARNSGRKNTKDTSARRLQHDILNYNAFSQAEAASYSISCSGKTQDSLDSVERSESSIELFSDRPTVSIGHTSESYFLPRRNGRDEVSHIEKPGTPLHSPMRAQGESEDFILTPKRCVRFDNSSKSAGLGSVSEKETCLRTDGSSAGPYKSMPKSICGPMNVGVPKRWKRVVFRTSAPSWKSVESTPDSINNLQDPFPRNALPTSLSTRSSQAYREFQEIFKKQTYYPEHYDVSLKTEINLTISARNLSPSWAEIKSSYDTCSRSAEMAIRDRIRTPSGEKGIYTAISGIKNVRSPEAFRLENSRKHLVQLRCLYFEIMIGSRGVLRAACLIFYNAQSENITDSEMHIIGAGARRLRTKGQSQCHVCCIYHHTEFLLLRAVEKKLVNSDPDLIAGWEIQKRSLGYFISRYKHVIGSEPVLGRSISNITDKDAGSAAPDSRPKSKEIKSDDDQSDINQIDRDENRKKHREHENFLSVFGSVLNAAEKDESSVSLEHVSTDTYKSSRTLHLHGRILINLWKVYRSEQKSKSYTLQNAAWHLLRRRLPEHSDLSLEQYLTNGSVSQSYYALHRLWDYTMCSLEVCLKLDFLVRTAEMARIYGIQFFEVLSRGSQFRVESILLRIARRQNYVVLSPSTEEVARQNDQEAVPLVMEPASGYYRDPVLVLDFRSLYPSIIIAYNLCYTTCLGKLSRLESKKLGVLSGYQTPVDVVRSIKSHIRIAPNTTMFVSEDLRKGIIPTALRSILGTRQLVIKARKKAEAESDLIGSRVLEARQLALKLLANVIYGYTAATWTGRMPCSDLADAIVLLARNVLEQTIHSVNQNAEWGAFVVSGDTDSLFVHIKGATLPRAFQVAHEIIDFVQNRFPSPIALKLEKVYLPCVLVAKKRYAGYAYESLSSTPKLDVKGLECIRRDQTDATANMLTKMLHLLFKNSDIQALESYFTRQCEKLLSGSVTPCDLILRQEVKFGTYQAANLPPAAEIAVQEVKKGEGVPMYGERVPYLITHTAQFAKRLRDMLVHPRVYFSSIISKPDSGQFFSINMFDNPETQRPPNIHVEYYLDRQIVPALQRVFGLINVHLGEWLSRVRRSVSSIPSMKATRDTLDGFLRQANCVSCSKPAGSTAVPIRTEEFPKRSKKVVAKKANEKIVNESNALCQQCFQDSQTTLLGLRMRLNAVQKRLHNQYIICHRCTGEVGGPDEVSTCVNTECPISFERVKLQGRLSYLHETVIDIEDLFNPIRLNNSDETHSNFKVDAFYRKPFNKLSNREPCETLSSVESSEYIDLLTPRASSRDINEIYVE